MSLPVDANKRIQQILFDRGITSWAEEDYVLADHRDGKGIRLATWNTDKLGPAPSVQDIIDAPMLQLHKSESIDANRTEAGHRIAALFGKPAGSQALVYAEINGVTRFLHLQDKQGRGETLTQAEQDFLGWARDTNMKAHAIRDAENAAAAAINAATTESEVDAVTVNWPA